VGHRRGVYKRPSGSPLVKQLRVTARVDPDRAPAFFDLLANSPEVTETRLLDWNTTADRDTVLYAIRGDSTRFAEAAPEAPAVASVETAAAGSEWTHALVEIRTSETETFDAVRRARTRPGLVVRKPIVYRDGAMEFRVVGDPAPLQAALEAAPEGVDVEVEAVGRLRGAPHAPAATLSDRQREAVEAALAAGYYDQPRGATHEDVATALGCAPATASDHLQKAEAKLVRAALDDLRPAR
jgi:predicted DNA binding protein